MAEVHRHMSVVIIQVGENGGHHLSRAGTNFARGVDSGRTMWANYCERNARSSRYRLLDRVFRQKVDTSTPGKKVGEDRLPKTSSLRRF